MSDLIERVRKEGIWILVQSYDSQEEPSVKLCDDYKDAVNKLKAFIEKRKSDWEQDDVHGYYCVTGDGYICIQELK